MSAGGAFGGGDILLDNLRIQHASNVGLRQANADFFFPGIGHLANSLGENLVLLLRSGQGSNSIRGSSGFSHAGVGWDHCGLRQAVEDGVRRWALDWPGRWRLIRDGCRNGTQIQGQKGALAGGSLDRIMVNRFPEGTDWDARIGVEQVVDGSGAFFGQIEQVIGLRGRMIAGKGESQ